jgi:hypothetical protein
MVSSIIFITVLSNSDRSLSGLSKTAQVMIPIFLMSIMKLMTITQIMNLIT